MRKHSSIHKFNYFLSILFSLFFCISGNELKAQLRYKVLFLGNSYTAVNDLPKIIHDVALSAGDILVFDSHVPGGYRLMDHSLDVISQNKIKAGGWDYVVIQGQSQEPVMLPSEFNSGGAALYNLIKQYNSCAVTMPYMTWGRKNGDASNCANYSEMCTYQSMDTTIRNRYLNLTAYINGEVSPVSVVWNYIRQNHPQIELYDADESHPSAAGSYAAACCFYASLFKKDPTFITFDFGLNASDASIIRNAVKTKVFDHLQTWDYKKPPVAKILYQVGPGNNEVNFRAINWSVQQTIFWNFGDGDTSSAPVITHSYSTNGTYTVTLTATNCDLQGVHTSITDTVIQFCSHTPTIYTSHPWLCNYDTLWTEAADSYQWFAYGVPIPETNRYLSNYARYGTVFSVMSTVNGCTELSQLYAEAPKWSGYFFDALGDPCNGDTVAFAVLSRNGLSGLENILWFKNGVLLPLMTNEDTLLITEEGTYECKVINPNSDCPLDTTSMSVVYDCGTVGIENKVQDLFWSVFPNPAQETITVQMMKYSVQEPIQIYNVFGSLIRSVNPSAATTKINIADLPNGLYYIRLKDNKQSALKWIKMQ